MTGFVLACLRALGNIMRISQVGLLTGRGNACHMRAQCCSQLPHAGAMLFTAATTGRNAVHSCHDRPW
eukprot:366153-Chlamydomonas_euryale.AAC.4